MSEHTRTVILETSMPLPRFVRPAGPTGGPRTARPPRHLTTTALAVLLASLGATALPNTAAHAPATSGTMDFETAGGAPTYRASGMTPDGSLPQDHFFKDIKWHFMRAGGAQLNSGGYATSLADYQTRWNATLAQYKRTATLGGTFVILPHDLWGANGTTNQASPGDNGDWTQFDNFVNQLFSDVKANNMTVEWDLWNEPDGNGFWVPSQSQYLQMWSRFYAAVRANFPGQLIVGPSMAGQPTSSNSWRTTYLHYVKANNLAPDIYSWHDEPADPVPGVFSANSTLAAAGLTDTRPYQINPGRSTPSPTSPPEPAKTRAPRSSAPPGSPAATWTRPSRRRSPPAGPTERSAWSRTATAREVSPEHVRDHRGRRCDAGTQRGEAGGGRRRGG